MKNKLSLRTYRDKKREYRWTLIAGNGRKLANCGEGYKGKAGIAKDLLLVLGEGALAERADLQLDDQAGIFQTITRST